MKGEIVSKMIATVVNVVGVVALLIGLYQTRQLLFRDPGQRKNTTEMDMDMTLLQVDSLTAWELLLLML